MQVFIFLATGFEEIEAIATIDVLRRADVDVKIVSVTGEKLVSGAHNVAVQADALFETCDFSKGEMLILPGGMPGTTHLEACQPLIELVKEYHKQGKYIAAICAAPMIFGNLNLLQNKEATCYPGFEKYLKGAVLSSQRAVRSGKIITAKGPGTAIEFALKIVETLKSKELAAQLSEGMIC